MKKGKIKRGFYFLYRARAFVALAVACGLAAVVAIPVAAILGSAPVWVVSGLLAAGMVAFIVLAVLSRRVRCTLCGKELKPSKAHAFAGNAYCDDCIGKVNAASDRAERAFRELKASGFNITRSFTVDQVAGAALPEELRACKSVVRVHIDDNTGRFCLTAAIDWREHLIGVYDRREVLRAEITPLTQNRVRTEERVNVGCVVVGFLLGIIWGIIALCMPREVQVPYVAVCSVVNLHMRDTALQLTFENGAAANGIYGYFAQSVAAASAGALPNAAGKPVDG